MSDIGRDEMTVTICSRCLRVSDECYARPCQPGQMPPERKRVEYVRADLHRGAVAENTRLECALEQVRARLEEGDTTGALSTALGALGHL